jgi:hypothetical protein
LESRGKNYPGVYRWVGKRDQNYKPIITESTKDRDRVREADKIHQDHTKKKERGEK